MNKKDKNTLLYRRENIFQKLWSAKGCYLALVPTFAFLLIFNVYPAFEGFFRSLFRWKSTNYFNPVFDGLDNYAKLFGDGEFWSGFGVLVLIQVAGFIKAFAINLPLTYLIFRLGNTKMGNFFQRAFIIPMMIPTMVTSMYWRFFYQHNIGVLDSILELIGIEHDIIWLGDYQWTLPAMLFKDFPYVGGFAMLLLLAGMLNVDPALEESARIDGASEIQIFKNIYLPLLIPQIKVISVMGMINGLQDYNMQLLYTSGEYNTMTPPYYMYKSAFIDGNYGYASAQGVILFVIILTITILQQKFIKKVD